MVREANYQFSVSNIYSVQVLSRQFYSYFDGAMHKNAVWSGIVEGLVVYFIHPLHPKDFFGRESIYNQPDDFDRFTYFSRAALEFLSQFGKRPNVIHLHDWPVAMVVCNDPTSVISSRILSCEVLKF